MSRSKQAFIILLCLFLQGVAVKAEFLDVYVTNMVDESYIFTGLERTYYLHIYLLHPQNISHLVVSIDAFNTSIFTAKLFPQTEGFEVERGADNVKVENVVTATANNGDLLHLEVWMVFINTSLAIENPVISVYAYEANQLLESYVYRGVTAILPAKPIKDTNVFESLFTNLGDQINKISDQKSHLTRAERIFLFAVYSILMMGLGVWLFLRYERKRRIRRLMKNIPF